MGSATIHSFSLEGFEDFFPFAAFFGLGNGNSAALSRTRRLSHSPSSSCSSMRK